MTCHSGRRRKKSIVRSCITPKCSSIVKCIFNSSESRFCCDLCLKSTFLCYLERHKYTHPICSPCSHFQHCNQIWQHKLQNVTHLTGSSLQIIEKRHTNEAWKLGDRPLSWAPGWAVYDVKRQARKQAGREEGSSSSDTHSLRPPGYFTPLWYELMELQDIM